MTRSALTALGLALGLALALAGLAAEPEAWAQTAPATYPRPTTPWMRPNTATPVSPPSSAYFWNMPTSSPAHVSASAIAATRNT